MRIKLILLLLSILVAVGTCLYSVNNQKAYFQDTSIQKTQPNLLAMILLAYEKLSSQSKSQMMKEIFNDNFKSPIWPIVQHIVCAWSVLSPTNPSRN